MKKAILSILLVACGSSDPSVPLDDGGNSIVDAAPGPFGAAWFWRRRRRS